MLAAVPAATLLLSAILSLPLPADRGPSLTAAAAAAGRPPECAARSRRAIAKGPTVWERARVPSLQRYCDLIARAHAQLASNPEGARDAAKLADQALSGRAAPAVVLARAALSLGSAEEAAREFERARAIDPRSVEDPSTMHDLARALRLTGKRDEALAVYRALVPRVDLLGTLDRRVATLLEAAHVAMAAATTAPSVDAGGSAAGGDAKARLLEEAAAYLREARLRPPTQLAGDVLLSLALVLDRAGDKAQADAALGSAAEAGARPRASDYLAAEEDRAALSALSLERSDPAAAAEQWQAFLSGAGGKGAWATAARARLAALPKAAPGAVRRSGGAPAPGGRGGTRP